ncbi:MAG: methylated-DNA--[protein]-cysteine S-methyltransferase [Candidatus Limnocylindrales bacterium]
MASDFGPVRVAATSRGVAAVALLSTAEVFLASLARRGLVVSPGEAGARAEALAREAAGSASALLSGEAVDVEALPLDLGDRPAWDQLILGVVRSIPRGSTASYGEVARRAGRPGAAQATGGAVSRNPIGLLIPCHRVIAADGSLGGYGAATWGGVEAALDLKAALLALEGVRVPR